MRVYLLTCITFVLLCTGCAAPGSALGRIALSGTIESTKPLVLKVTLPKEYGLSRLDLAFSDPNDFGHTDQRVDIDVDESEFHHEFPPVIYHILMWFIPPLGSYPKQPPEPFFYVEFSDAPDEVYLIGFDNGAFVCQVYDAISRQRIDATEASWTIRHGEYVPVPDGDSEVWQFKIKIEKPNNAASRDLAALGP